MKESRLLGYVESASSQVGALVKALNLALCETDAFWGRVALTALSCHYHFWSISNKHYCRKKLKNSRDFQDVAKRKYRI